MPHHTGFPTGLIVSAVFMTVLVVAVDCSVLIPTWHETDITSKHRWLTGLVGPLTVGLIGLWGWAIRAMARARGGLPAGGVPIRRDGATTRVLLPVHTGAAWTWGGAMWTSIGGMIVLGLSGTDDPIAGLARVAALVPIGSATFYAWHRFRIAGDKRTLTIDAAARRLTLPATFGRRVRIEVPFDAVRRVHVRTVDHGKDSFTHAPTLTWSSGDGGRTDARLAQWADEDRAIAFARWLEGQVSAA